MAEHEHPDRIVLHIAGADRPGVTARLTEIIAEEDADLVDIGQSVLHGYLMLSAIVDIPITSNAFRKMLFAVADLGLRMEVSAYRTEGATSTHATDTLAVTVLGPLANGRAAARITSFMAERGMNIREIRSLSERELNGLELIVDLKPGTHPDAGELMDLRGKLLTLGTELGVDLAVQKDDIFRRDKRLVCMDVDSTFVKGELIDELASLVGAKEQVAQITARAMRGELDVKLLEGLPFEKAKALADRSELTPGADRFVHLLQGLGYRIGLVSGGFTFFVDDLKARFGLDFAVSNELEIADGKLTGRVRGSIVDGERKGQVLRDMAQAYRLRLGQTIAIGDGANDILMLQEAGLGIAFRAKPKLQAVAHMSLNHSERLDTLLYLMGYNAADLREAEAVSGWSSPPPRVS
jgi:phosphoserine phosphatase